MDTSKLKPGDEVAWRRRYNDGPWHATTVNRVLSTQIVTEDGMRWTRKNGFEVGGGTSKAVLREMTPEIKQAAAELVEREALIGRFDYRTAWKSLDLATLRRVKAALDGEAVPS